MELLRLGQSGAGGVDPAGGDGLAGAGRQNPLDCAGAGRFHGFHRALLHSLDLAGAWRAGGLRSQSADIVCDRGANDRDDRALGVVARQAILLKR
ncbi:hypothetical protein SDC9_185563 [bioreactor metagenome]|uniref:Uncharacterized protein n=1 Tax=bioreactor metagenome TaxID=1076179 RepID=A0A645HH29_9ZZZZ